MAIDTVPTVAAAGAVAQVPCHHSVDDLDTYCNVSNAKVSSSEVENNYDGWAADYEHDTLDLYGFKSPSVCAATAAKYAKNGGTLLDLGCGTGLIAKLLKQQHGLTFSASMGCDMSNGMMQVAKDQGLYTQMQRLDMNVLPWDLPSDSYDVVTCNGVLIYVENVDCLDEFVRVTKPGGHMCIMFRHDGYPTYQAKAEKLIADGKWELVHKTESQANFAKAESKAAASVMFNIWVFRKC